MSNPPDGPSKNTEATEKRPRRKKGGTDVAMPARQPTPPPSSPPIQIRKENWYRLMRDWLDELAGQNKTAKTCQTYREGVEDFARYARGQGVTLNVGEITREHIQAYMIDQLHARHLAANSARSHLKAVKLFFRWCVDDGELDRSPAARVVEPMAPEEPPKVLTDGELRKLFATCERGDDFNSRRDYAVLRILLSVGMRRGELANIRLDDFDWDGREVSLFGKQRRHRGVTFGREASKALRRYLRERDRHRLVADPHFWLGQQGPLTGYGLYQIVRRRAKQAGLDGKHPHLFRHTASHLWLAAGGSEMGLKKRMGWKTSRMLDRYGASEAERRSKEEYNNLAPDDLI